MNWSLARFGRKKYDVWSRWGRYYPRLAVNVANCAHFYFQFSFFLFFRMLKISMELWQVEEKKRKLLASLHMLACVREFVRTCVCVYVWRILLRMRARLIFYFFQFLNLVFWTLYFEKEYMIVMFEWGWVCFFFFAKILSILHSFLNSVLHVCVCVCVSETLN